MFKENDIRPFNFKEKHEKMFQQDLAYLIEKKNNFIDVDCPVCSTKNTHIKFIKHSFSYLECMYCSMLYISPRPTFDILKDFYSSSVNYKFFNDYIFPASKEIRREKIFIPRVNQVLKACKEKNIATTNILEIGAGYGLFLEEMSKRDIFKKIVGIEASDSLHKRSIEMGFDVYNGIFEELDINDTFDVIVSFEVIEHIFDPKSVLKKIFHLLDKNGMLVMTFPNYNGFDISTLMDASDSVEMEHLNYFNEKSIKILLEEIGFQDISISTPGVMDVDLVRNKILENKYEANSFLKDLCVERYDELGTKFQEFLIANNLSSNMMIIAIK
ncbi:class I SAM-dependent methyltransferase [Sulfurimonas sp.]|uniref:class I SAM-dependent methyltransferase n=1 Tax=Sulfurimonas sp. TaxID=2022749 RepID=UPI0039E6356C